MITKPRVISLKFKIALVLAVVFALVGVLAGFLIWNELNGKVREISRQKLISIAQTTAALIDAEEHEDIQNENSEEYEKINEFLAKATASNLGVDDIYTLRKTEKENIWYFVGTGYKTTDQNGDGEISLEEEKVEYGEEFDVANLPEMKRAFEVSSADREINCDSWGCWLSGYAPILDSSGKAVAVLAVDISASEIVSYERQSFRMIFLIFSASFISFCIVIFLAFRIISRPATKIISGISDFGRDINSRIDVRTGDEFEMIAESFNMMANEFQKKFFKEEDGNKKKEKKEFSLKGGKKRVLIVEDEEELREKLKNGFEESNLDVVTISDGIEGLEKAFSLHPDLIVLDILAPELNGADFLKKLRKDNWGVNASVMVLANIGDYKKLEEVLDLGVDEYIIKADWNIDNATARARTVLGMK